MNAADYAVTRERLKCVRMGLLLVCLLLLLVQFPWKLIPKHDSAHRKILRNKYECQLNFLVFVFLSLSLFLFSRRIICDHYYYYCFWCFSTVDPSSLSPIYSSSSSFFLFVRNYSCFIWIMNMSRVKTKSSGNNKKRACCQRKGKKNKIELLIFHK